MIDSHVDKARLMNQVIDPVWDHFAIRKGREVIDIHARRFPFCLPFLTVILKITKKFLLFAINGNLGVSLFLEFLTLFIDILELGISIGVLRFPFNRLLISP